MIESENTAVTVLGGGMSTEEMMALYVDEKALIEAPEKVFRLNTSGNRYYYTFENEHSEPKFFVSVTTMISQTLPTSPHLIKWMADMGHDESKAYAAERASYGTFMHMQIADFLINKTYNLDDLKVKLRDYIECEKLPSNFIYHADELKKDMLSFAQFAIETNLIPIAIEIVLTHPTDGYAGAIDLACEFDGAIKGFHGEVFKTGARAGQPKQTTIKKRVRAILDFKSGRKGFYDSSRIQLKAYQEMWNKRFPDYLMDHIFNWSPKEWRGSTPTYNLEDQTNHKVVAKLPYLVELARIENNDIERTVVTCGGILSMQNNSVDQNIKEVTLTELVCKKKTAKDTPTQTAQTTIEEIAGEKAVNVAKQTANKKTNPNTPPKKTKPKKQANKKTNPNTPPKKTKPKKQAKKKKVQDPKELGI